MELIQGLVLIAFSDSMRKSGTGFGQQKVMSREAVVCWIVVKKEEVVEEERQVLFESVISVDIFNAFVDS